MGTRSTVKVSGGIKKYFCIVSLFAIRYAFVLDTQNIDFNEFYPEKYYHVLFLAAAAVVLSFIFAAVVFDLVRFCGRNGMLLGALLLADPLMTAGSTRFFEIIAVALAMICVLLILKLGITAVQILPASIAALVCTYLEPMTLFSLVPMIIAVFFAKAGKVNRTGIVFGVVTALFGVAGVYSSGLQIRTGIDTGFAGRLGWYEFTAFTPVFDGFSVAEALPKLLSAFVVSLPVIAVAVLLIVRLVCVSRSSGDGTHLRLAALLVVPFLISTAACLVFGNDSIIVSALNFTTLSVLLISLKSGNALVNTAFERVGQLCEKHWPVAVTCVFYLSSCTAFFAGENDLFKLIVTYVI